MKNTFKVIVLILITTLVSTTAFSQKSIKSESIEIATLLLEKNNLPDGYKLVNKEIPITKQASSLYNQIDMYSMILKLEAKDKKYQSIKSSKDKGTVYYILFDSPADNAKEFVQGLVWGANEPNDEHPDEIIVKGNLLVVLSFNKESKIKEIVKSQIDEKIKK